jgi:competence protein ComFC
MNQSLTTHPYIVSGKLAMSCVFDWLFPRYCFGCKTKHQPEAIHNLCIFCWEKIFKPNLFIYEDHRKSPMFAAGFYDDLLQRIVILSKFKHHHICTDFLVELIHQTFQKIPHSVDIITSVPSNYWRSLKRGVDLPGTLAKELSKRTGIEFRPNILKKSRKTDRQLTLTQKAREKNVKDLFIASPDVRGRNILVIDDIVTTGNTIMACHHALRREKPCQIIFLTCAKTKF